MKLTEHKSALILPIVVCLNILACYQDRAQDTNMNSAATTKTELEYLIAGANRIVITNLAASRIEGFRSFSLTISGDEAKRIVRDVSTMRYGPPMTESIFDWELRFYRDADYLTAIHLASATFMFEKQEYFGDTGELQALSDKLLKLTTPPSLLDDPEAAKSIIAERADLGTILQLYHELSGLQLVESSEVKRLHPAISFHSSPYPSKAEALKLIEKALIEQAAVVVTQLDDKRVSVTLNDALLPLKPTKD
jgi:hypothetical protein